MNINLAGPEELETLPGVGPSTAAAIIGSMDTMAFGGEMSQRTRDELTTYLTAGTINAARIRETLSLAMSSSAFQWY